MKPELTRNASLAGSITAAVAASACCLGPLVFAMLGIGGAGFLVALEPYRPLFTVLTFGLLAVGFYTTYRNKPADDCGCEMPKTNRTGKRLLWMSTVLVAVALGFPYLTPYLF